MMSDPKLNVQPTFEELKVLATQGNCVPVFVSELQDLVTPVSAYLKVAEGAQYSFLLESVAGGEKLGRYSFIGSNPTSVLRTGPNEQCQGDPLVFLEAEQAGLKYVPVPGLPSFTGGAIGYIAYDCVHHFEPRTARPQQDVLGLPEAMFMFCDELVVFDHLHHQIKAVSHVRLADVDVADEAALRARYDAAVAAVARLLRRINSEHVPVPPQGPVRLDHTARTNVDQATYEGFVKSLKKNIVAGDIIQAVPSRRVERSTDVHPFNVYRRLRSVNPAPYMFYLDFGGGPDGRQGFQIVGASPETLVKVVGGVVETHPIAGTRKRGRTPEEDAALAEELLADPKERAEHIMLVDLGRNDVNRVCQPSTVKVDSLMHIERYSHVMHIVSRVTGRLRPGLTPMQAFRSVFPAGTVSGAPKVRAIELVGEYERDQRSVYAGAVGYFGLNGDLDTAIALRTMVIKDGVAYLQAGGGIVFDSDPPFEFEETLNKLNSNVVTLRLAEQYFSSREKESQQQQQQQADADGDDQAAAARAGRRAASVSGPPREVTPRAGAKVAEPVEQPHGGGVESMAAGAGGGSAGAGAGVSVGATSAGNRTLMIDNYDSFTWNVYQYLSELGANVAVYRNDKITLEECIAFNPTHVVLSPGPGTPADTGVCKEVLRHFAGKVPVLGVCMGEQVMCEVYGGTVGYAGEIMHGKTSLITNDGKGLYEGCPAEFNVIRYHSLALDPATLPSVLEITSRTAGGIVMGVRHKALRMEGVQYHPESILSEHGKAMFKNFLSWTTPTWEC